jgi:hypothetical protein
VKGTLLKTGVGIASMSTETIVTAVEVTVRVFRITVSDRAPSPERFTKTAEWSLLGLT